MLERVNPDPRFVQEIAKEGLLAASPLVVVDVGASGGFWPFWSHFGTHRRMIGFEPDAKECARLRESRGMEVYPVALGAKPEQAVFHQLRNPCCSSFLEVNREYWARFPLGDTHLEVGKSVVDIADLDGVAADNGLETVDFIKLDTEGTELDVLKGAAGLLENEMLGVQVEVAFQPIHHGRPLFGEVDAYLRDKGFALFDLSPWRHARKALPPIDGYAAAPSTYGQVVWGEALYFKDLAAEIGKGQRPLASKIVKTVAMFDLFMLPDCAIELLEAAMEAGLLEPSYQARKELLVPTLLGRRLPLDSWRVLFNALPQI